MPVADDVVSYAPERRLDDARARDAPHRTAPTMTRANPPTPAHRLAVAAVTLAIVALGCGADDDATPEPTTSDGASPASGTAEPPNPDATEQPGAESTAAPNIASSPGDATTATGEADDTVAEAIDTTTAPDATGPADARRGFGSGNQFSVRGGLSLLPAFDDGGDVTIVIADLLGVSDANGLTRPDDATDEDAMSWVAGLMLGRENLGLPTMIPPPATLVTHGLSSVDPLALLQLDAFASVETSELQSAVVAGDIVAAVGDRPTLGAGSPINVAQGGTVMALSTASTSTAEWTEAGAAGEPGRFDAAATALDEAGVVSAALIGSGETRVYPGMTAELAERFEVDELTEPFDVLGLGWSTDDHGAAVITAVYDFGQADAAAQALPILESRYRDGDAINTGGPMADLVELGAITTDGALVIATMTPGPDGDPSRPFLLAHSFELIFVNG